MFFGDQKQALLDYLRNLSPQTLLLVCSALLGYEVDWSGSSPVSWQGTKLAVASIACASVAMVAYLVSTIRFVEEACCSTEDLRIALERIERQPIGKARMAFSMLRATWQLNKKVFAQVAMVAIFATTAYLSVVLTVQKTVATLLGAAA
jgi:hypothetical protein